MANWTSIFYFILKPTLEIVSITLYIFFYLSQKFNLMLLIIYKIFISQLILKYNLNYFFFLKQLFYNLNYIFLKSLFSKFAKLKITYQNKNLLLIIIFNYNYNLLKYYQSQAQMSNFLQSMFLASKSKAPLTLGIGLSFTLLGATFGYLKAKRQAEIDNENYSQAYLKQYISEDQVNYNIDNSNKPAVLYYYQPGNINHFNIRHGFIKGSALAHNNADFYMVNLTKKLEKAIPQLQHKFLMNQFLMQIRFPKSNCQILYTNGEQIQRNTYRRQFFNHQYLKSQGVQNFLQQNGILKQDDPMQDFIKLTKDCLFEPIIQDNERGIKDNQNK